MANAKSLSRKSRADHRSKFNPGTRDRVIAALKTGVTIKASAEAAGISYHTLRNWIEIGDALDRGDINADLVCMPKDTTPDADKKRRDYLRFFQRVIKAKGEAQERNLRLIAHAGADTWTHYQTGEIRYIKPDGPVTWTHKQTGEIRFKRPMDDKEDSPWDRQWSGTAWARHKGDWKATAWILERCYGYVRRDEVEHSGDLTTKNLNLNVNTEVENDSDRAAEIIRILLESGAIESEATATDIPQAD